MIVETKPQTSDKSIDEMFGITYCDSEDVPMWSDAINSSTGKDNRSVTCYERTASWEDGSYLDIAQEIGGPFNEMIARYTTSAHQLIGDPESVMITATVTTFLARPDNITNEMALAITDFMTYPEDPAAQAGLKRYGLKVEILKSTL